MTKNKQNLRLVRQQRTLRSLSCCIRYTRNQPITMSKLRSFTLLTLALFALMPAVASEDSDRFTLETNSTASNSLNTKYDNTSGKKYRNGVLIDANSLKEITLKSRKDQKSSPAYLLHSSLPNNQ